MISGNRYFLYGALLLLAPEVATANLILPMISFTFPAMCMMLIAVILVEFFVLTRRWSNVDKKSLLLGISMGNFFSTLFGVPIAWFIYFYGITEPVHRYLIERINGLPLYLTSLLKILVYAPIMPYSNAITMYINFILTLLPAYFLSYWIEYFFIDQAGISNKEILSGVRSANRYSYLFVLAVATIYFLILFNSASGGLFVASLHWICEKGMFFLFFLRSGY